jgi:hypothetical protein
MSDLKLSSHLLSLVGGFERQFRKRLAITYTLTLIENLCYIALPAVTGLAADGLLRKKVIACLPLIMVWLCRMIVGNGRHIYDTSVFTAIYSDVATGLVKRQRGLSSDQPRIIARVSLSRELVSFFETDVPAIATAMIKLGGAIVMMAVFDWAVSAVACIFLAPIAISSARFWRRSLRLNAALNNRIEREPIVVTKRSIEFVNRHFRQLRYWRLKISLAKVTTWTLSESLVLVLVIWTLFRLTSEHHASAGQVYAVMAYVWSFHQSVDEFPNIIHNVSRMQDISHRVAKAGGQE